MNPLNVVIVSSECEPFAKTGGMADVVSALSKELGKLNVNVMVFLPFYKNIMELDSIKIGDLKLTTQVRIGSLYKEAAFFMTALPGSDIPVYLVRNDEYFFRGELYSENGNDYPDNLDRFAFFNKAIINFILLKELNIHLIHCHDWQAALIPVYLKIVYSHDDLLKNIKTLFTIHNFSYQGIFNINEYHKLNLNWEHFTTNKLEYFGNMNLLKGAINFSDMINTVSLTYKDELINNTGDISLGLTSFLKAREDHFLGILNGADYGTWNPEYDVYLRKNFNSDTIKSKSLDKKDLLETANLKGVQKPLLIMISRLVSIKGFDILLPVLDKLLLKDINFIILGEGPPEIKAKLLSFESKYDNFKALFKFDESLAHKMQAGADILIMPSHFEPCGLNQIYSLKYGTLPVVYHTGGLADTIIDYGKNKKEGTGFVFYKYNSDTLLDIISEVLNIYGDKMEWKRIQINAMNQNFSWERASRNYLELYLKMTS